MERIYGGTSSIFLGRTFLFDGRQNRVMMGYYYCLYTVCMNLKLWIDSSCSDKEDSFKNEVQILLHTLLFMFIFSENIRNRKE